MGSLEKLEAAELHEGNVSPAQLDFQQVAVVRGSDQHGLAVQRDARFAVFEDVFRHVLRLARLVLDYGQNGQLM